jgi:hypothetical protein
MAGLEGRHTRRPFSQRLASDQPSTPSQPWISPLSLTPDSVTVSRHSAVFSNKEHRKVLDRPNVGQRPVVVRSSHYSPRNDLSRANERSILLNHCSHARRWPTEPRSSRRRMARVKETAGREAGARSSYWMARGYVLGGRAELMSKVLSDFNSIRS